MQQPQRALPVRLLQGTRPPTTALRALGDGQGGAQEQVDRPRGPGLGVGPDTRAFAAADGGAHGSRASEAIWYREDHFVLERLNGEKVLDWKILDPDRMEVAGGSWNSVQAHPAGGVLSVLHALAGPLTEGGEHAGHDGLDDGERGDEAVVGRGGGDLARQDHLCVGGRG